MRGLGRRVNRAGLFRFPANLFTAGISMYVQTEKFLIGSYVRVIQGCFTGLTGVVVSVTDGGVGCLLRMDNWRCGAYLKIKSNALALNEMTGGG